jgi:hypothetical protein
MKTAGYGCLNLEITAEFVSGTGPVGDGIAAVVACGVSHSIWIWLAMSTD